jgi:hypothetical protein
MGAFLGLLALGAGGCSHLPSEAQGPFDEGCRAADIGRWDLAVARFEEARSAAPGDPGIVYNLGVAHARAGHPFEAACWLRFYLALAPGAPDADAVLREVVRLEACTRSEEEESAKPAP